MCYHEIKTIRSLPGHPNIIPPAQRLVVIGNADNRKQALVCGTIYPYLENGSLDDRIAVVKSSRERIDINGKIKWCYQMSSAIYHTHHVAHTYHMDIKPGNMLLDTCKDLILCDWEQSGAPRYTLAPEADGSWDVQFEKSVTVNGESKLIYKKYQGPTRQNLPYGSPKWNVFPIWRVFCPRALEAAEVFSLGRTMWMLLKEMPQEEIEDLDTVVVSWSESSCDIPDICKAIVSRCLDSDPNGRINLQDLVEFWNGMSNGLALG